MLTNYCGTEAAGETRFQHITAEFTELAGAGDSRPASWPVLSSEWAHLDVVLAP